MEDARAAVVPQQPRAAKKIENEVQRRNRRVLGDIGNVNAAPPVVGVKPTVQISRPMTRSFRAQLLANAQEKKEKNNVNLVLPVVDRGHAQAKKLAVVPKKATEKPKPEAVIAISSDDEKENDRPVVHQNKPARKEVKTLTSILTARSKAMVCEVNIKPKETIVDFDSTDANNELEVVEYLDDLYKFYKLTENESRVHDYMDSQPDVNTKMRSILIDWLVDLHKKFELMPETFYLTVNIIDRYLSTKKVSRTEIQLVGISSMVIASKYEEIWAPQIDEFVCLSDYAYTGEQILLMEKAILGKLEWYLTVPTPYVFLSRYIKASIAPNDEMKNMVFFLAELGIMHYPIIILYSPSLIAAAAVYAARCTLNKMPFWTETLKHHTGFAEEQLRSCAKLMVGFHLNAAQSKLQAVYQKYSQPELGSVARFSPAKIFQSLSSS